MSSRQRNYAKDVSARQRFNRVSESAKRWELEAETLRQDFQEYRELTSAVISLLQEQSNTDPLTGLANRRAFDHGLRRMIEDAIRHPDLDEPLTLVLCDLDGFKAINDKLSHDDGDKALQDIAKLYKIFIHPRTTDLLARPGGDEFTYIAIGDPHAIEHHFKDLREHLEQRQFAQSMTCPNGFCYDVEPYHRHGLSFGLTSLDKTFIKRYNCQSFTDLNVKLMRKEISVDRIASDLIKETDSRMYAMKRNPSPEIRIVPPAP